jgi:hypothetical protein
MAGWVTSFFGRVEAFRVPHGGSVEHNDASSFEDPVNDGFCEVGVVQDMPPLGERFVGSEENGLLLEIACVDDVVEHVGSVVAEAPIADLVDDEHLRSDVSFESLPEIALGSGDMEVFDDFRGRREESVISVENRFVRQGDGEVCLPAARLAIENEASATSDQFVADVGAEHLDFESTLHVKVELLEGLEERKFRGVDSAFDTGQRTFANLFSCKGREEVAVAPLLRLRPVNDLASVLTDVRQMQAL